MSYGDDPHGQITPEILLKAYSIGLFPMAENADDPSIFWIEPEIRGVMPLDEFHVPRSLKKVINRGIFDVTFNQSFDAVVRACAQSAKGREETWINATIRKLYGKLHEMGNAHSVEVWYGGQLAGGLYGVSLGRAFFGESMFMRRTNASKVALVHLVDRLKERGFVLLDTQFNTEHLAQFGTIDVPRDEYLKMLDVALIGDAQFA